MKIVVCLKQVPATDSRIKPDASGSGVDLGSVSWEINPYDEFALEEALLLKEKHGGEVVVVSLGGDKVDEALRNALARGADKAVVVKDSSLMNTDALTTAKVLAAMIRQQDADLVFCGKQAVDDDRMAVPAMVAELLDWPQVTVVVKLTVAEDGASAVAEREIEGGHEVVSVQFPAVIAAQKGLNEPRSPNIKGIMGAKKKPLETAALADLGVSQAGDQVRVLEVASPPERSGAKMIEGNADQQVAELVRILHEQEKLI